MKGMTITYKVKNGLYVNMTNRCPCACTFCLRQNGDGVYGSDSLWLIREPTVEEVCGSIAAYDGQSFEELVFCGYGEPTERLDDLLKVASWVKASRPMPIRINTNGLSDLINGRRTAPELSGLIDTVSISLNATSAEEYNRLCRPRFGMRSYQAMLDFTGDCVPYVPNVIMTVVDVVTTPEQQEQSRRIAEGLGARLRVRPFEG